MIWRVLLNIHYLVKGTYIVNALYRICIRMDDVEKLIELHMLVYPDVKSEIKSLEGLPLIKVCYIIVH